MMIYRNKRSEKFNLLADLIGKENLCANKKVLIFSMMRVTVIHLTEKLNKVCQSMAQKESKSFCKYIIGYS